jgi:hypothetical protein
VFLSTTSTTSLFALAELRLEDSQRVVERRQLTYRLAKRTFVLSRRGRSDTHEGAKCLASAGLRTSRRGPNAEAEQYSCGADDTD